MIVLRPAITGRKMSQRQVYIFLAMFVCVLWNPLVWPASCIADEPEDPAALGPPDLAGTDVFRSLFFEQKIEPLTKLADVSKEPQKTVIVLLGGDSLRRSLTPELEQAVSEGAVLLVASDRSSSRTSLRQLFGVEITGEEVTVAEADCYKPERTWPFIRTRGIPWLPVPRNSPAELFNKLEPSGASALVASTASPVNRTWLADGEMTPLQPLAGYPPSAERLNRGKLNPAKDHFAVGGKWGKGQVLILGDHTIFTNFMLLTKDNGNILFATDLVRWLKESGTEPRTVCLFVEEGVIRDDFELPSPEIPLHEQINMALQAANDLIPELQAEDQFNRFIHDLLAGEGITPAGAVRILIVVVTFFGLIYLLMRSWRARVRNDPARTLITAEVAAMIPRGGVLRQRFNAVLESENLYEHARDFFRGKLESLGAQPDLLDNPPRIRVDEKVRDPRRMRKMILRMWSIAYGTTPRKIGPNLWYELLDEYEEVWSAHAKKRWKFVTPGSTALPVASATAQDPPV